MAVAAVFLDTPRNRYSVDQVDVCDQVEDLFPRSLVKAKIALLESFKHFSARGHLVLRYGHMTVTLIVM